MAEKLYFDKIKEDRGDYFVEYHPPISPNRLATLYLTFSKVMEPKRVAELIESESEAWIKRYPVAVFSSAFDDVESQIEVSKFRESSNLVTWLEKGSSNIKRSWKTSEQDDHLSDPSLASNLKSCRLSWAEILSDLRNSLEHDDRILQRVGHDLRGRNVVVLEPELKGRPVRELVDFIFDRLAKFVEEVTVHSLQRKMMYGFIFEEIPLSDRDAKSASRFKPGISRDNIGWNIEYSSKRFDES